MQRSNRPFLRAFQRGALALALTALRGQDSWAIAPGDIAMIGYASDDPDAYGWVSLVNIPANTTLNFTDSSWQGFNPGGFRTGEHLNSTDGGPTTWSYGGILPAGSVVRYQRDAATSTTGTWSTGVAGGASVNLSNNGDQVFAYQGAIGSPTLIYGIQFANAAGVVVSPTANDSTNTTNIPTALSSGNTFVDYGDFDNGYYIGPTSFVDSASARTAIGNTSNWIRSNNVQSTASWPTQFNIGAITNNSVITTVPANVVIDFGRMMQGSTAPTPVPVNLSKTGSNATTYTVTTSGPTAVSLSGTQNFAGGNQSATFTVGMNTSTLGAAGNVLVSNTGSGVSDAADIVTVTGQVVAQRVVTATSLNFGRVMQGQQVSLPTDVVTSGSTATATSIFVARTTSANADGLSASSYTDTDNNGASNFDDSSDAGTRTITGAFNTAGVRSGSVNLAVTPEGLTGEGAYAPVAVNYTAAVLQNRDLGGATVNVGKVIRGTPLVGVATIAGDAKSDTAGTRLVLANGAVSNGPLSVSNVGDTLFAAPGAIKNVRYSTSFASTGLSQSQTVNLAPLIVSGEQSAPALTAGSVAIIGWDEDGATVDSFAFVPLQDLSPNQTIYFTDNGWSSSTGGFRGASAALGAGNETLLKFTAKERISAGTVISSVGVDPSFVWNKTGAIPGASAGVFSDLSLGKAGEQIVAFTGPTVQPLVNPQTHLFLLDDSGSLEDAIGSDTGALPPGLSLANGSAVVFNSAAASQSSIGFHIPASLSGGGNRTQWLAAIADSSNWTFGASGVLPTAPLIVSGVSNFGLLPGQTLDTSAPVTVTADVLDASNASFNSTGLNSLTIDFGSVMQNSGASRLFSVFNLGANASLAAKLDLDSISASGDSAQLTTTLSAFSNLAAGDRAFFGASLNTAASGSFNATYTLNLSDENGVIGGGVSSLLLHLLGTVTPLSGSNEWAPAAGGAYSTAANWTAGVPNGAGSTANFLTHITSDSTITVANPITLQTINFTNTNHYHLVGAGPINLSGVSQINVNSGSHSIDTPINVSGNLTIGPTALGTLSLGQVDGAGGVTLAPGASVTAGHVRSGGLLLQGSAAAQPTKLSIDWSAPLPAGSDASASRVSSLSIASDNGGYLATLDIGNNDLLIDHGSLAEVTLAIATAYNGSFWDKAGLTSSFAGNVNDPTYGYIGIGIVFNDEDGDPLTQDGPLFSNFGPFVLTGNEILVKPTYYGDANLDGVVDFVDYGFIDAGIAGGGTGWLYGDFNYDGVTNFIDYGFIDAGVAGNGAFGLVPEPSGGLLFSVGAAGLIAARFRRRRVNAG